MFKDVNEAYGVLSDKDQRAQHDAGFDHNDIKSGKASNVSASNSKPAGTSGFNFNDPAAMKKMHDFMRFKEGF